MNAMLAHAIIEHFNQEENIMTKTRLTSASSTPRRDTDEYDSIAFVV